MNDFKLRSAAMDDVESISRLVNLSTRLNNGQDFSATGWRDFAESNSVAATLSRITNRDYFTRCAFDGDQLIGIITIKNFQKIDQLFVLPSHWRRGVARSLWSSAKASCQEKNSSGEFWVRSSTMAIPVYQRFGFVGLGPITEENGIRFQLLKLSGFVE